MEQKSSKPYPLDANNDKEIIKEILLEKESDEVAKDRMYRILYEASMADDKSMDTDLIDECIKTIDLIEGNEEHVSDKKLNAMRQNVDKKYKDWRVSQRSLSKKRIAQIAACFILFFFTSAVVANAFGYTFIQSMIRWGEDTFNLSTQDQSNEQNGKNNVVERKTYDSVQEAIKDIPSKALLPKWVPDNFTFKYAEKFSRPDNTNILLYYQDSANKVIVFDLMIYDDKENHKTKENINFEKDNNLVEIYEHNKVYHYILQNLGQVQAIWNKSDVVYNISGDVSVAEMKKIINLMYGG